MVERNIPKFFKQDKLLRDQNYRVIGRVMLNDVDFQEGGPIPVVLLQVPKEYMPDVRGQVFYVDGKKYRVPADIQAQKLGGNRLLTYVNNFYLEPVND
jgi:hypothetical protein